MRETHCMNHKWIAWNSKSNGLRILWHMNLKTKKTTNKHSGKKLHLLKISEFDTKVKQFQFHVWCAFIVTCVFLFANESISCLSCSSDTSCDFKSNIFFPVFLFSVKGFQCFGAQNVHRIFWYCCCFGSSFDFIIENHWSYLKRKRITFGKQCSQNSGAKRTWVWCVLYR